MRDLRRQLGSLDNLVAFETAARLSNFSAAARELHISQPAISRRIRQLELALAADLFSRHGTNVALTAAGTQFYNCTLDAFRTIQQTIANLPRNTVDGDVSLRVNVAAAALWLMPAIGEFYNAYPNIRIHLVCIDELPEFEQRRFDLEVKFGLGEWPHAKCYPLLDERVFPVASPAFLRQHRVETLDDLPSVPLIQLQHYTSPLMDWRTWLPTSAVTTPQIRRFTTYAMVLEAAVCGHGVALGWDYYVQDSIKRGDLQPLAIPKRSSDFQEYLVVNPQTANRDSVEKTVEWLLDLAKRTRFSLGGTA